ncbi:MAG TPA: hypothetical protein PK299_05535 [Anaerolineales bacterium]|nr:hypothetical protein [Anaerolineales bacterium]
MKKFLFFALSIVLSACSQASGSGYITGNIGPASLSVTLNQNGEVELSGQLQFFQIGNSVINLSGGVGFEKQVTDLWGEEVAGEQNTLTIVIVDNHNNQVRQEVYNVNQEFKVDFPDKRYGAKQISSDGNGNILVILNQTADLMISNSSGSNFQADTGCILEHASYLATGQSASVATYQVSVHIDPGSGTQLVPKKYLKRGRVLYVEDGPYCIDGYYWWFVSNSDTGIQGWVVEVDPNDGERLIVP